MDENVYFHSFDGANLMYRRWMPARRAQKPPVVLLHGAASNSTRWWHFVEHSCLSDARLLLRPDLRGHGESLWRGPARFGHWSRDIAEMLHREKQACAFVVGHCLGANIALNFASRFPEMCAGLVLVEPMAQEAVSGILAWLRPFLPVLWFFVGLIRLFNRIGIYRRQLESLNLRVLDRQIHEASSRDTDQVIAKHGSPLHDIKVIPSAQYIGNFIEIMQPLPLSAICCPCLVIQSSGWRITNPMRTRITFGALSAVEFTEVESDHWIPALYPDYLRQLVDKWILRY